MKGNRLVGRYEVTGTLRADSALSVAEGKEGAIADISCQRDGLGRLVIPGTALAGCLRRVVEDSRWGGQPGKDRPAVSRITTYDATFQEEKAEQLEIRDGVTIDRNTGAAAERMLHGREVVAPGSTFDFGFSVDVPSGEGDLKKGTLDFITRLVLALKQGITVGGSTTRGLGQVSLDSGSKVTWTPLADREEFLHYLKTGTPQDVSLSNVTHSAKRTVSITVPWQQQSPLLVSVPITGSVQAIPRHIKRADGTYLTLPGSSIKGVLRHHAERIVRTLRGTDIPHEPLKQFQEELPLVCELFGQAPDSKGEGAWRGAVTCIDVLSSEAVKDWDRLIGGLLDQDREKAVEAATSIEESDWLRVDDHVAISRWTGGSDDGKLFATVAPWPTKKQTWKPMEITVDLERLGPDADACLMLLAHVLRDLCEGWLAFGHGATRGYGEVTANASDVEFSWKETGKNLRLTELFDDKAALAQAWHKQTQDWYSERQGKATA